MKINIHYPTSSPTCLTSQSGVLAPRRPGAPRGNKNALGHGAPRGNRNGVGHGAPRGNRNALKFGVYTREFTRPIAQPPGMSLLEALELEKHRLRLYIRDKLASVNPASLDYGSHLALLRAATIAAGRIRRLHRHILRIQASHAFESHLGRSIARELALFHEAVQGFALLPSLLSPLPSSVLHNNCLLVPLFSQSPHPRSGRNRDWGIYKPSFEISSDIPLPLHPFFTQSPLLVRGGVGGGVNTSRTLRNP